MKRPYRFVALVLLLLPGMAAAQEVIEAIRFEGNEWTRESIMRQEMVIHEGDPVDGELIERSRQAIMDLGLFKRVEAQLLDGSSGKILLIRLQERYYFLPIPRIDGKPEGDYSYGIELRHDNVAGLNQRARIKYLHKDHISGEEPLQRELTLQYIYPRVVNTPLRLGVTLRHRRERIDVEDEAGDQLAQYEHKTHEAGLDLMRWLSGDHPSKGWLAGGGIGMRRDFYDPLSGTRGLYWPSQAVEVRGRIEYHNVSEHPYHREGEEYGYHLDVGVPQFASDYHYVRHLLFLRAYTPFAALDANFNSQLQFGLASGSSFGEEAYKLGGSSNLRGYESDIFEGNSMVVGNFEYHQHISGYRQMRAVLFWDVGNTFPSVGEISVDDLDLHHAVGLGLRWRVQSFVDVTLRVDAAYGIDSEMAKVYLSTSGSF